MKLTREFLFKIFITLSLAVGFIPNFGAIDKVATQWLFLNCLGVLFLLNILFNRDINLIEIFKNRIFILLFFFLIWIAISIIYAINPAESLVVFSQYFSWLLLYVLFYFSLKSLNNQFFFISGIITLFLIIETLMVVYPFFTSFSNEGIQYRSFLYLGAAANINITAFSLLYKIPFLIYFKSKLKINSNFKTVLSTVIISLIFFEINTLLLTRSAILSCYIISFIFIGLESYLRFKRRQSLNWIIIFTMSILISNVLNSAIANKYGSQFSSFARVNTITENLSVDATEIKDGSISQRLRFYSQAINQIKSNPFIGIGIGNWKIKSIEADKNEIIGYRVPYHAHNDFLELTAETGVIGVVLYLLIIFYSWYLIIKLFLKNILKQFDPDQFVLSSVCSVFFILFLIDSMLNFPMVRPIEIILFIITISFISLNRENNVV